MFDFEPKDHLELGSERGWIDMARGARLSGSRFAYRIGDVAVTEMALYQFVLSKLRGKGFMTVLPPILAGERAMYGTGFLPTEESNLYRLEKDDLYLTGTSEVALAGHPRRRAAGGGPAARQVRGLHDELQARGGCGRQGHQGHVPGAPVRQGRDVRLLRARAVAGDPRAAARA